MIDDVHVSLKRAAPLQSRAKANILERLRLLVVDRNIVCLKLVAALLNKCRYKVMCANDDKESVMKGVSYGARDYLIEPVRLEEVKNIWQHVVWKNLFNTMKSGTMQAGADQNPPIPFSKRQREKSNEEEEEQDDKRR
ncbi:unnamed protein product [Camellia sinensis]